MVRWVNRRKCLRPNIKWREQDQVVPRDEDTDVWTKERKQLTHQRRKTTETGPMWVNGEIWVTGFWSDIWKNFLIYKFPLETKLYLPSLCTSSSKDKEMALWTCFSNGWKPALFRNRESHRNIFAGKPCPITEAGTGRSWQLGTQPPPPAEIQLHASQDV